MQLQEYDYTIVYKSDKTHLEPDCLSCHCQPLQTRESDGNKVAFIFALKLGLGLAKEQDKDPTLKDLKECLRLDPTDPAL